MPGESPDIPRPTVHHRDPAYLAERLTQWLPSQTGSEVVVSNVDVPESNGMSSETVLFSATWDGTTHELVAKVAPDPAAVPVFENYDLGLQFRVMKTVRASSSVPVPEVLWLDETGDILGAPFFVMRRLYGDVPPDVMPYNFGSWVSEASAGELSRLQKESISILAGLHSIGNPVRTFELLGTPGLSAHVAALRGFYDWVCGDGMRSPLIEAGFAWLIENWPATESESVLSWGDARIGNMMYQDFTPVAVLDWEMAALAPREVDLGWFIFLHRFFEDIAASFGLDGMPGFLRRDEVAAEYEQQTGYTPKDLDFYTFYAALRHAVIMFRIQRRAIAFGEASVPEDPDEMILHHKTVKAMIAGTYWEN